VSGAARDDLASSPLGALNRAWWFPVLPGLRSGADTTYERYDLDDQPEVAEATGDFAWLDRDLKDTTWSIDQSAGGSPVRPFTLSELESVTASRVLPESLRVFAAHPELQHRVRSATGCYLDLGDFAAETSAEGAQLVHVLSDSQWVRHWLVYVGDEREAVVTSADPIGFNLPDDDDDYWEPRPPEIIPLDGSFDLDVCADSFVEFIYRFWIENELFFATKRKLPPHLAAYADQLRGS
jgi:hypothetical protein